MHDYNIRRLVYSLFLTVHRLLYIDGFSDSGSSRCTRGCKNAKNVPVRKLMVSTMKHVVSLRLQYNVSYKAACALSGSIIVSSAKLAGKSKIGYSGGFTSNFFTA